jgi:hypothetical protein
MKFRLKKAYLTGSGPKTLRRDSDDGSSSEIVVNVDGDGIFELEKFPFDIPIMIFADKIGECIQLRHSLA